MNPKNLEIFQLSNPWWETKRVTLPLPASLRRRHFNRILEHFSQGRLEALALEGPRRVGKSTLMFQVIDHWLRTGAVSEKRIVYLSLDDPRLHLETVFEDLEEYVFNEVFRAPRHDIAKNAPPCILVLDEITAKEGWELFVKTYIDQRYPLRFLLSGSSQTFISKRSRDSLPGRLTVERMLPFCFSEVLATKEGTKKRVAFHDQIQTIWGEFFYHADWKKLRRELNLLEKEGRHYFLGPDPYLINYLYDGGFPEYFLEPDSPRRADYFFTSVIERTVLRDIPAIFDVKELKLLERSLLYGVEKSGQLLNISNAASDLGTTRITANSYFHYLVVSGLLIFLEKYAATVESRKRALERLYAIDPGFYVSVAGIPMDQTHRQKVSGLLAEMVVLAELCRHPRRLPLYYWRDGEKEVDFVVPIKVKPVPIEVKFRKKIENIHNKGVHSFCEKFKVKEAILITQNEFDVTSDILRVPLTMFLG